MNYQLLLAPVALMLLGACAGPMAETPVSPALAAEFEMEGLPVEVVQPENERLVCLADIPQVRNIPIAVGEVPDRTGTLIEDGGGSVVSQGVAEFFFDPLMMMQVPTMSRTDVTKANLDWEAKYDAHKHPLARMGTPFYHLEGGVVAFDAGTGGMGEVSGLPGPTVGYREQAVQIVMTVRLNANFINPVFMAGETGAVVTVKKPFAIRDFKIGADALLGAGSGLTLFQAIYRTGAREAVKAGLSELAWEATAQLMGQVLVEHYPQTRRAVQNCLGSAPRQNVDMPAAGPAPARERPSSNKPVDTPMVSNDQRREPSAAARELAG